MTDTYRSFWELETREREGEDWTREYVDRGSRILVMAPHGGWIEPLTAELAHAVAANDLSIYAFRGIKRGRNQDLHLTSHRFDEPLAVRAASSAHWILTIHGERSPDSRFVMVGGLWAPFRRRMSRAFVRGGFRWRSPRPGLGGERVTNICNRGWSGEGGQLEISEGLRRILREDPDEFLRFVELVRGVVLSLEAES